MAVHLVHNGFLQVDVVLVLDCCCNHRHLLVDHHSNHIWMQERLGTLQYCNFLSMHLRRNGCHLMMLQLLLTTRKETFLLYDGTIVFSSSVVVSFLGWKKEKKKMIFFFFFHFECESFFAFLRPFSSILDYFFPFLFPFLQSCKAVFFVQWLCP